MTQIKNFLEKPEVKLIKGEFLKSKWQIEGGIGFNIQIVPSRLNSAEYTSSNSTRKERIENSMGIAPGLALALNIQPIKNKYLAYQYQVKFSEAWLFPMSASTYWEAHHLALGYEFLFFTMNFEYSNLTYSYSDQTTSSSSLSSDDILEEKSNSIYESNSNSYGVQWLMNNENFQEMLDSSEEAKDIMIQGTLKWMESQGKEIDLDDVNRTIKRLSQKIVELYMKFY